MSEVDRLLKEIKKLQTKPEFGLYLAQESADKNRVKGEFSREMVRTISGILEDADTLSIEELSENLIKLKSLSVALEKAKIGTEESTIISGMIVSAKDALEKIRTQKRSFLTKASSVVKSLGGSLTESLADFGGDDSLFRMLGAGSEKLQEKISQKMRKRQEKKAVMKNTQLEKLKLLRDIEKSSTNKPKSTPKDDFFDDDEEGTSPSPKSRPPLKMPTETVPESGWLMEPSRNYDLFTQKEPLEFSSSSIVEKLEAVIGFVEPIPNIASNVEKIYNLLDFERIRRADEEFDRVAAIEHQSGLLEKQTDILNKAIVGQSLIAGVGGTSERRGKSGGSSPNSSDSTPNLKKLTQLIPAAIGTSVLFGKKILTRLPGLAKGTLKNAPLAALAYDATASIMDSGENAKKFDTSQTSAALGSFLGGADEGGFGNALLKAAELGYGGYRVGSLPGAVIGAVGGLGAGYAGGKATSRGVEEASDRSLIAVDWLESNMLSLLNHLTPEGGILERKFENRINQLSNRVVNTRDKIASDDARYSKTDRQAERLKKLGMSPDILKTAGSDAAKKLSPEALNKVIEISNRIGVNPDHLIALMNFETGGSFKPDERNKTPGSTATGLIQFTEATAKSLGTSTTELAKMTQAEQLDYVEKYFQQSGFANKMKSLEDMYLMVLTGNSKFLGASPDDVVFRKGTKEFNDNPFAHSGEHITVGDISKRIQQSLAEVGSIQNLSTAAADEFIQQRELEAMRSKFEDEEKQFFEKHHMTRAEFWKKQEEDDKRFLEELATKRKAVLSEMYAEYGITEPPPNYETVNTGSKKRSMMSGTHMIYAPNMPIYNNNSMTSNNSRQGGKRGASAKGSSSRSSSTQYSLGTVK